MKLLVADDHTLFRDGLVNLLEAAGFAVVGQVGHGAATIVEALALRPDVVLVDMDMDRIIANAKQWRGRIAAVAR